MYCLLACKELASNLFVQRVNTKPKTSSKFHHHHIASPDDHEGPSACRYSSVSVSIESLDLTKLAAN